MSFLGVLAAEHPYCPNCETFLGDESIPKGLQEFDFFEHKCKKCGTDLFIEYEGENCWNVEPKEEEDE